MEAQPLTRYIHIDVDNEYVRGAGVMIGAVGSHNDVILEMEFSEMWTGADAISFCWLDANGENPTIPYWTTADGKYYVNVPAEAKAVPGKATLAIKGVVNVHPEPSEETEPTENEGEEESEQEEVVSDPEPPVEARAMMSVAAKFIVLESEWDRDAIASQDVDGTLYETLEGQINAKADKTYVDNSVAGKLDTAAVLDYLAELSEMPVQSKVIHYYVYELLRQIQGKQDILTFDTTPRNTSNPVTSSGIKTALAGKQDKLNFDTTPDPESTNPVESSGIYTAIQDAKNAVEDDIASKQDILSVAAGNIDENPDPNSQRPITSGGVNAVKVYLQGEIDTLDAGKQTVLTPGQGDTNFDIYPTENANDKPVSSGGVYYALGLKQDDLSLSVVEGCICLTYSDS